MGKKEGSEDYDYIEGIFNGPFCIINKEGTLEIHRGRIEEYHLISELPPLTHQGTNYISILPYCQIKEKGFETHDDGEPIITLHIDESKSIEAESFLSLIQDSRLELETDLQSNLTDDEYERMVGDIIKHEISNGEGSNFLISRKFHGKIRDFKAKDSLSILKTLMINETGSYWNFLFYTGSGCFVGASPERHLCINGSKTIMNPISGTLPKRQGSEFRKELLDFITDPKEVHELFQVVDEELKVICKLCPQGGKVVGPFLKEMNTLIHTEYYLEGEGVTDIWEALKSSIYAATMIGSPLQNAARVIKKYEKESRRYYSSVICSFGLDEKDQAVMDNAITIRTMEIDANGSFVIQSGNTIVRDSNPELETKELKSKAQGLLNAILNKKKNTGVSVAFDEEILDTLALRNEFLSGFWLNQNKKDSQSLVGIKIDLINNEDDFIYMIKHMLDYLGADVTVYKYDEYSFNKDSSYVLIGPGPGDPNNREDKKIAALYSIAEELLANKVKVLGICLGHQILMRTLGFELRREEIPYQGVQKEIDLFGEVHKAGFYNSYFAIDNGNTDLLISKNHEGKIYAAKGKEFISFQFHLESVLTQNGMEILKQAVEYLALDGEEADLTVAAGSLQEIRDHIDLIDRKLIDLLSERGSYVKQASKFKNNRAEVRAEDRIRQVLNKVSSYASQKGVSVELVEKIYTELIESFIRMEQQTFEKRVSADNERQE